MSQIKYVVACNVIIVQNKYNINKNIEQYNIKEFNKKIYFFIHLNNFCP